MTIPRRVLIFGAILGAVLAIAVAYNTLLATQANSNATGAIAANRREIKIVKQLANANHANSTAQNEATNRKAQGQQKILSRVVNVLKIEKFFEQGTPGQQGIAGVPGASVRGPVGPVGQQGIPGAFVQGPVGAPGAQGSPGASVVGATGAAGTDGSNGQNGDVGPTGPAGVGVTGPQGDPGSVGATGPQGNVGATGPPGSIPPGTTCTLDPVTMVCTLS